MENEEREKLLEERKRYYSNTFVLFELIKCLKNRELCFLSAKSEETKKSVRYLLSFSIDYLKKHFEWINFLKFNVNMYNSVALLKDIPVFSYNLKERTKEEKYKDFNKNYKDFVVGYDLFFDIDCGEDFKDGYDDAKQIKEILEEYKVPYTLINSSKAGFHLRVSAKYTENLMPIDELIAKINKVMYNIKGVYDLKNLDTSVIDIKRVAKLNYSYVDGYIALPLDDKQFSEFTPEMVKCANVLRNVRIKNRGSLERTYNNLSFSELQQNTLKFLNDFS